MRRGRGWKKASQRACSVWRNRRDRWTRPDASSKDHVHLTRNPEAPSHASDIVCRGSLQPRGRGVQSSDWRIAYSRDNFTVGNLTNDTGFNVCSARCLDGFSSDGGVACCPSNSPELRVDSTARTTPSHSGLNRSCIAPPTIPKSMEVRDPPNIVQTNRPNILYGVITVPARYIGQRHPLSNPARD